MLSSREIGSRSLSVSTSLPNMIRPTVVYVQPTEVTAGWGRVASKDDTGAQKTLRDYYQVDLSEGRYEEAWSKLTNEYRNYAFSGGFASFKSQQQRGYTPLTELSGSGETCYQVHEANKLANPAYASRFNPNWSNYVDQAVFYGIFSDGGRFYFCLVKDTFSQWRIHTVSRAP